MQQITMVDYFTKNSKFEIESYEFYKPNKNFIVMSGVK